MKKIVLFLLVLLIPLASHADAVNGELTTIKGVPVLKLWGNHYERGYAYGYLAGEKISDVFINYFFSHALSGNAVMYNTYIGFVNSLVTVDSCLKSEAQGIVNGMIAGGFTESFKATFSREMNENDIIFANCIVELASLYGCSSLASWGSATADDPELQGELVITRHLDWQKTDVILRNHLVIAHDPSDENEQKWVSFGVAGMFGCLSGTNESGLTTFQHMGNKPSSTFPVSGFNPVLFTMRRAIELKDYNNDTKCNSKDILDAITNSVISGSFIIDACSAISNQDSAIVIEADIEHGKASRTIGENSNIAGTNLAATNHFRVLMPALDCSRYDALQTNLNLDSIMSISNNWEMLAKSAGQQSNIQTIQVIPAQKRILLGLSTADENSFDMTPTEFLFEDFYQTSDVNDNLAKNSNLTVYPNPFNDYIQININRKEQTIKAEILDILGNSILSQNVSNSNIIKIENPSEITSGIYFLKITDKNGNIINISKIVKK